MDLNTFTSKTIAELKSQGGTPAVIEYLKPFVQDVTIQKVNGWLKTQKFPFEVAQAVFANEFEDDGQPSPQSVVQPQFEAGEPLPPPQATSRIEQPQPPQAIEPEPSSELTDPTGGTVHGVMVGENSGYPIRDRRTGQIVSPVQPAPRPIAGQRHNDIRVRDARERGSVAEGPQMIDPPLDMNNSENLAIAIEQGVQAALAKMGLGGTQNQNSRPEPVNPPRPRLRSRQGDDWNTPRVRPVIVQQQ